MQIHHTITRRTPLVAVLMLFALVAAACGNEVSESAASRTARTFDPGAETGVEYGATLDEWAEDFRAPAVLEPKPVQSSSVAGTGSSGSAHGSEPTIDPTLATDGLSIAWDDLIPAGQTGQEIVDAFAERLDAVEPGSAESDALYAELRDAFDPEAVNPELDGQEIRLAGFVAPLTYEDEIVTEFLLVPNFGACVHVPPPPPNQTIMVTADKDDGLTIEDSWGAVWVQGAIVIEASTSDLASASYRIDGATSWQYTGT